jgi:hypothetical protein
VCILTFVVVTAAVVITCPYSCHYEDTSYPLFIYLCMSQCYDNGIHDLPEHVRRLLKGRDDVDGNKYRSIIVSFVPVTVTVTIYTCQFMLFPFLLLHADSF